jgi:hypothetical protein
MSELRFEFEDDFDESAYARQLHAEDHELYSLLPVAGPQRPAAATPAPGGRAGTPDREKA